MPSLKATVLGAGAWGTALADLLARSGHQVKLWAYEPEVALAVSQEHANPVFLPGFTLHDNLEGENDMPAALDGAELVVLVMPSHVFRSVLSQAAPSLPPAAPVVACSKGIEDKTGYTMHQVAAEVLGEGEHSRLAALSGPSFAKEVAAGAPTAVTVASNETSVAEAVQAAFAGPRFRVYTSRDVTGVELGGAVKNPLAIAAGMVAGLELGSNVMAAMITRGLAEMTRLGLALGAKSATMAGLAGLGDLVLTCTGGLSRNRTVGTRLAQGETIDQITGSMRQVAEGVKNTSTVLALAERHGVEMPIIEAVRGVLEQKLAPMDALNELMSRDPKPEVY
ncbi:MAG: NAD(P)-dependent glycerol-3-phosphate dehydrogenase [Desulfarculaceae bacterium]|nr:NAD(P)-dependent glycerol-3-phosphate dehydrogenase [Desulfarculaceae bacterium]MCF8074352.1 NAD(P)-dependent glycerol-3-phosphate dehydrogenase [Desulfarculaceae bacterium]MCF8103548.1 NAD(P)-dependent glycerol-3-phosphate dehydrogenase [Desulfarculaceae bacterium]MCF8117315.1 NAD(P)-dependent glycerol-3-phosphate dehydrogenase [Desulfarculaceae bacterium]